MTMLPEIPTPPASVPELRRDTSGKAIAGVASGLASHLGLPVRWVRVAFIVLAFLDGLGVLAYAALWLLVPAAEQQQARGLESASRQGFRPQQRTPGVDAGVVFSIGAVVVGILWVLVTGGLWLPSRVFWPVVLGGVGVVLVWLQVDRSAEPATMTTTSGWWARLTAGSGPASVARLVGGLLLVGIGVSWILATQVGMGQLPQVLGAAALLLAGLLVVAAPWLYRTRRRLRFVEQDRMRAEARADMAAHLHDSVLQTLALIQRSSTDPAQVSLLARRQERELRTWLYGSSSETSTLSAALEEIRGDTEENFPVAVEVVCVGDTDVTESLQALVQASREAVTNAAKHSGADRIDVFAEVAAEKVELFVRDRGKGFDPDLVRPDRMGVRDSIRARMERHGGSARIRTAPGEGTEVMLEMSR
ncbi:MAG: PspC domain-containing protein [Propionibacteriaceae bacterium]|nr:PspC domain-containing protein [Propionibacteriaceae bacterium]